jgi:hypothetical protein
MGMPSKRNGLESRNAERNEKIRKAIEQLHTQEVLGSSPDVSTRKPPR